MPKKLFSIAALLILLCLLAATPALANTVFTDDTFNLSDYGPLLQYLGNPDMSGSVQQSLDFGNPASSVEFILHWPGSPNTDVAYQGLIHNGWSYDPGT